MTVERTIGERVEEALNNALSNGYDMAMLDTDEIVEDLLEYDADLEDESAEDIKPHVSSWLDKRKN